MVRDSEPSAESKDPYKLNRTSVASGNSHDALARSRAATRGIERTPSEAFAGPLVQGVLRLRLPIRIRESARSAQEDNLFWRRVSRINDACKILHLDTPTARWDARGSRRDTSGRVRGRSTRRRNQCSEAKAFRRD